MSKELEFLIRRTAIGRMNRRDFIARAAALGVAAPFANVLLSEAAKAAGPVKGGMLKAGMVGGESTDGLDPARSITVNTCHLGTSMPSRGAHPIRAGRRFFG
jgi:peptide/nickel transport system substrate-binding protein